MVRSLSLLCPSLHLTHDHHSSSDYNFVRHGNSCEPVGPEPIPAGVCTGDPKQKYKGSSGFRKIPGNTCEGGKKLDEKVEKECSKAQPKEGSVVHQTFSFNAPILQYAYFKDSTVSSSSFSLIRQKAVD